MSETVAAWNRLKVTFRRWRIMRALDKAGRLTHSPVVHRRITEAMDAVLDHEGRAALTPAQSR